MSFTISEYLIIATDAFKRGDLRDICFAVVNAIKKKKQIDEKRALERSQEFCPPVLDYDSARANITSQTTDEIQAIKEKLLSHFLMMFGYFSGNTKQSHEIIQRRLALINQVVDGATGVSDDWKKLFYPDLDVGTLSLNEKKEISDFIVNAFKDANTPLEVIEKFDSDKKENILFIDVISGKEILREKVSDPKTATISKTSLRIFDFSRLKFDNLPKPLRKHIETRNACGMYDKLYNEFNELNISSARLSQQSNNKSKNAREQLQAYYDLLANEKGEKGPPNPFDLIDTMKAMTHNFTNLFPNYVLLSVLLADLHKENYEIVTLSSETIKSLSHFISKTTTIGKESYTGKGNYEVFLVHKDLIKPFKACLAHYYKTHKQSVEGVMKVLPTVLSANINIFPLMKSITEMFNTHLMECNTKRQQKNNAILAENAELIKLHAQSKKVPLDLTLKTITLLHIPPEQVIEATRTLQLIKTLPPRSTSSNSTVSVPPLQITKESSKEKSDESSRDKSESSTSSANNTANKKAEHKASKSKKDKKDKDKKKSPGFFSPRKKPILPAGTIPPVALEAAISNSPKNLSASSSQSATTTPPPTSIPAALIPHP